MENPHFPQDEMCSVRSISIQEKVGHHKGLYTLMHLQCPTKLGNPVTSFTEFLSFHFSAKQFNYM